MLIADNMAVARGKRTVLRQIFLSLQPGRVLAVVGPNGSGKSTLLAALAGDLPLQRGKVRIKDRELSDWLRQPREMARFRAVLPQSSQLNFNFPVVEVVMMGRSPHLQRGESAQDYDLCQQCLERLDIGDLADRPFTQLSGGERQRVHLARVMAQIEEPLAREESALLFLDEPTNNLDLKHQMQVLAIAREYARRGAAVMIILHDLTQARQHADEVIVLKRGNISGYGPPAEVLSPARLRAVFEIEADWIEHGGHSLLAVRQTISKEN